jgi:rare lipoprotein A
MKLKYATGICSMLSLFALSAYGQAASAPAAAPMAAPPKAEAPAKASSGEAETGLAAVYSDKLNGHRTASGQRYDRNQLTAAHKTLPFGTQVKVTHVKNGKSVIVRINDRGPVQAGRVLDLSPRAAKALGISPRGMAEVRVEVAQAAPAKKK